MNYWKSVLVGLATFVSGFALFRLTLLLLQIVGPHLEKMADSQTADRTQGWGISFGPGSSLVLLLLISAFAATCEYRQLKNKERSAR